MTEKLILMHENAPYLKISLFLKPYPHGAAPVIKCQRSGPQHPNIYMQSVDKMYFMRMMKYVHYVPYIDIQQNYV